MEKTYTINMLKTFEDCPQRYKFMYVDNMRFPEQKNSKTETGTRIHALINYKLNGKDVSKMVEQLDKNDKLLWYNFLNSPVLKYHFLESEYAFDVKFGTSRLTGRIDALFETDGEYVIVDWKTGEISDENERFQTMFYLCALYEVYKQKHLPVTYDSFSLRYVLLNTGTSIRIAFSEDLFMQYRNKIIGIIDKIETGENYFCYKTDKCKNCKYLKFCPYW